MSNNHRPNYDYRRLFEALKEDVEAKRDALEEANRALSLIKALSQDQGEGYSRLRELLYLIKAAECPQCDGSSVVEEKTENQECCGHYLESGECCGMPIPSFRVEPFPCAWCGHKDSLISYFEDKFRNDGN